MTQFEREEWLTLRRSGIGGSDAAGVLGVSKYKTPLQVYMDKIGRPVPRETTPEMSWGNRLEDDILDAYAESRGVTILTGVFRRRPDRPYMIGNLDGWSSDNRIVEAKAVGYQDVGEWGDEGSDHIPADYLCQAQHYLAVTGAEACDVAALFGGQRFKVFTVLPDQEFIGILMEREAEFWERVQDRRPPAAVGDDAAILRYVYPLRPEAEPVELGPVALRDLDAYEAAGADVREAESRRNEAKARILEAMRGAIVGFLPDGRKLRQSVVEVKEHAVKASTYVRMSVQAPKVQKSKAVNV